MEKIDSISMLMNAWNRQSQVCQNSGSSTTVSMAAKSCHAHNAPLMPDGGNRIIYCIALVIH